MENNNLYKQNNVIALVIRHFSTATEDQRLMVTELIEQLPVEIDGLGIGFESSFGLFSMFSSATAKPRMQYVEQEGKLITKSIEEWNYTKIKNMPTRSDDESNGVWEEKYAAWLADSSIDVLFIEPSTNGKDVQDSWYIRNLRPTELAVPEGRKMEDGMNFEDKAIITVTYGGEAFRGPGMDLRALNVLKWFNLTPSDKDNVNDPRPFLAGEMQKVDLDKPMPNGLYSIRGL